MFEKKAQEMMEKAQMIQVLGSVYATIERQMQWDCMRYNDTDDEHDEPYFTEYEDGEMNDYQKIQMKAYKAVMDAIEKLAR